MNWSRMLIPTLKETPQEAEIPSHQLMLRAGLIRRLSAGLYTFLPLGLRALRNVERIIREEMNAAGAQELLMPALQPRELWERTGRYETMADVMFRIRDRQERAMVLGPTHEEVITDLAAREISSYRQLPMNFYQIQTKFRDEIRPRFGLMRAKEFIMKDAYSFDADWDGAEKSYRAMYDAYERLFARCGLRTKVVEADTGAMGGSDSHEFMVLAESGEDGIVECSACAYAANLEKAESAVTEAAEAACPPMEEVETPSQRTIDDVSAFLRIHPARLIKTLIYLADGRPVAACLPGDRDVNELKLARAWNGAALELAGDDVIERVTGAPVGFAGPAGLRIPVIADVRLKGRRDMASGANRADAHVLHVDLDRDAEVSSYADISFARAGDACPRCGAPLEEKRGIEVGHVFKLGTKYSEALQATYLDADGREKVAIMGCYGIGVTRTLQALIEQRCDEHGMVWPVSVAPYPVEILLIDPDDGDSRKAADAIRDALSAAGWEALIDDRDERPGVKFNDADLLGLPLRVTVGPRGLKKGIVEIKDRASGEVEEVARDDAPSHIVERLKQMN